MLGSEHENERDENIESAVSILEKQKGKVVFHAGETHYGNTDLLHSGIDDLEIKKISLFKKACINQNIELQALGKRLDEIKNINPPEFMVIFCKINAKPKNKKIPSS